MYRFVSKILRSLFSKYNLWRLTLVIQTEGETAYLYYNYYLLAQKLSSVKILQCKKNTFKSSNKNIKTIYIYLIMSKWKDFNLLKGKKKLYDFRTTFPWKLMLLKLVWIKNSIDLKLNEWIDFILWIFSCLYA